MDEKNFHIKKNIKDLEYSKILNLIMTIAVILATFVISVAFSSLQLIAKTFFIVVPSLIGTYAIVMLHKSLETKVQEIEKL